MSLRKHLACKNSKTDSFYARKGKCQWDFAFFPRALCNFGNFTQKLEAVLPALDGLADWTVDGIHDALIGLAESLEVKNATLMWPVRIAAAGKAVTPGGAVEICHILGKDECLRRLRLGLDKLGG